MAILAEAISNMYFHVSETFTVLLQSHRKVMLMMYDRDWRELTEQFLCPYILPEDQALALDLLAALLIYGYRPEPIDQVQITLINMYEKVMKIAQHHYESNYQDSDGVDVDMVETDRRVFYVLSLIIENYTVSLAEHLGDVSRIVWIHPTLDILYAYLQTLRSALPETPESFRDSPLGASYDTLLSTLGVVVYMCLQTHVVPMIRNASVPIQVLYVEYMKLWPLRFDQVSLLILCVRLFEINLKPFIFVFVGRS
ncbi:hypothetical protein EON65_11345 [archaeon]|nr:MAG: hypothetical protein EON65_11345 [archaeon]